MTGHNFIQSVTLHTNVRSGTLSMPCKTSVTDLPRVFNCGNDSMPRT